MTDELSRRVYRSSLARWGSYAWFVLAAVNLVDIGLRGTGQSGRVAFTVVVAVTVLVYLVAFRPAIVIGDRAVVLRNVLRDVTVPWPAVTQVDATDALRVHAGGRVYRSWAVHAPNRDRARATRRPVPTSSGQALADAHTEHGERTHADFVAQQVQEARQLFEQSATRPADVVDEPVPSGGRDDPYRRWNVAGAVSLAVSVVLVLVAAVLP